MRKRKMWVGYLFILPSFVGVLLFVLIPYIDVVRRAFMQTASGQFVGLLNFKSILHNKAFLLAFTQIRDVLWESVFLFCLSYH